MFLYSLESRNASDFRESERRLPLLREEADYISTQSCCQQLTAPTTKDMSFYTEQGSNTVLSAGLQMFVSGNEGFCLRWDETSSRRAWISRTNTKTK